jgi:16S rRNA (uracil1498-N3)-methyltransferase
VLFDGQGAEFQATVQKVGRSDVELSVTAREEVNRESPIHVTLGVALPKGDRQKWLVEKAVELGVTRLVPLKTERGVAQPVEQALQRLRRSVVEASKQCGRNLLLKIDEPRSWSRFVDDAAGASWRLLAHPQGYHKGLHWLLDRRAQAAAATVEPTPANAAELVAAPNVPESVFLAIGPEGGFTGEEVAQAIAAGWHTIDLGPRILRVETAALALSALVIAGQHEAS